MTLRYDRKKHRQGGQATLEAAGLSVILLAGFALVAYLLLYGWLRFEISQLTQKLAACLDSTTPSPICVAQFRQKLGSLPGGWRHLSTRKEAKTITVHLRAEAFQYWLPERPREAHEGGRSDVWIIEEQKTSL